MIFDERQEGEELRKLFMTIERMMFDIDEEEE
jgi:hypothetical protein